MRTLLRLIVVAVILIVAVVVIQDTWGSAPWRRDAAPASDTVGTDGTIDTGRAREVGAEIGEKTAIAAQQVKESAHDATITTKIKAKMALDDLVRARAIDVSTDGSTVTLGGSVSSEAERARAIALARETDGVTEVFDQLKVR